MQKSRSNLVAAAIRSTAISTASQTVATLAQPKTIAAPQGQTGKVTGGAPTNDIINISSRAGRFGQYDGERRSAHVGRIN
jgi:hypothetical protein